MNLSQSKKTQKEQNNIKILSGGKKIDVTFSFFLNGVNLWYTFGYHNSSTPWLLFFTSPVPPLRNLHGASAEPVLGAGTSPRPCAY